MDFELEMCSRFELSSKPCGLLENFGIKNVPMGFKLEEVYPSNNVLCFNNSGAFIRRWGLQVNWSNNLLFNARAETLLKKHTFRPFLKSKCLVPATAYFEWQQFGTHRIKNKIFLKNQEFFGLAGVTNGDTLIIITRTSPSSIAHINRRMPMIVPQSAQKQWNNNSYPIQDSLELIYADLDVLLSVEEDQHMASQMDLFETYPQIIKGE